MKDVKLFSRNFFCLIVLIAFSALPAGADNNTPDTDSTVNWQAKADSLGVETNDIAVLVNGEPITESDLQEQMEPRLQKLSQENLPPQFQSQMKSQIRKRTLDRLVVTQLFEEEIQNKNVSVTDQDVMEHLKKAGAQNNMSLQQIKQMFESQGRSFQQVVQQMKNSKGMKYQKLMDQKFEGKLDFTLEDAKQYYTENKDNFKKPERVKASHILIKPDPNIDPNLADAQAKKKAQELLRKIKQEGQDFASLAEEHSDGPSAKRGGDLGYFPRGKMVPAFDEAAFSLKDGQVSDPVKTRFGYHIIKVTGRKESTVTTFEEAKENIMRQLKNQKKREIAKQYIEELKQKADIQYPPGKKPEPARPSPMMRPAPK